MPDYREFGSFDNPAKKYFPNLAGLTRVDCSFYGKITYSNFFSFFFTKNLITEK